MIRYAMVDVKLLVDDGSGEGNGPWVRCDRKVGWFSAPDSKDWVTCQKPIRSCHTNTSHSFCCCIRTKTTHRERKTAQSRGRVLEVHDRIWSSA